MSAILEAAIFYAVDKVSIQVISNSVKVSSLRTENEGLPACLEPSISGGIAYINIWSSTLPPPTCLEGGNWSRIIILVFLRFYPHFHIHIPSDGKYPLIYWPVACTQWPLGKPGKRYTGVVWVLMASSNNHIMFEFLFDCRLIRFFI